MLMAAEWYRGISQVIGCCVDVKVRASELVTHKLRSFAAGRGGGGEARGHTNKQRKTRGGFTVTPTHERDLSSAREPDDAKQEHL